MKQNYLYILVLLYTLNVIPAHAQSYVESMLTYKVTVHYSDYNVVAHVEPVEKISLSSDKTYFWFGGNQIHTTQGGYSGKLLNGTYEELYPEKSLKESGNFKEGLKTGIWKNWTKEGILIEEFHFHKGRKQGPYVRFDKLGKMAEKGMYKDDQLEGKQEKVVADSTVTVYYKSGKVVQRKSIFPKFIHKIFPKKP